MIPIVELYAAGLAIYVIGALGGFAAHLARKNGNRLTFTLTAAAVAGSVLEAIAAAACLFSNTVPSWSAAGALPGLSFSVRLDPLSGFFLLALSVLAGPVFVYTIGYRRHGAYGEKPALWSGFSHLLMAALTLVFTASNLLFFLICWELAVGASYFLISAGHQEEETRRGGLLFMLMSRAGAGMIYLGLLLLALFAGSTDFADFRSVGAKLPPPFSGLAFLLLFGGFGVKAGIIPFHIWLPAAHPVAPSNISALLSGIVIKTGIYGIARVCFDFYGELPPWAGILTLTAGVASAVLGVLYALMEHDLKRLLAFHSIENIGIILMGFGAALLFRSYGHPSLAAVAVTAGLYHTLNHVIFKGLLFLAAGAVVSSAHTRNMEEMGGLVKRLPLTALCFLIGAAAISGLPPLNGFVSEWLTYQALLAGFGATSEITRVGFPLAGALLALTAALAAACFVKAFGITFLALPRSEAARRAKPPSASMNAGMILLAGGCALAGLGAHVLLRLFDGITNAWFGVQVSSGLVSTSAFALNAPAPRTGAASPLAIGISLAILGLTPYLVWRIRRRQELVRVGPTWDCGLPGLTAAHEMTATAFSKSIRMIFSVIFRPRREIQAQYDVSPYFPKAIHFESEIQPALSERLYEPLREFVFRMSLRLRQIQAGSLHAYLGYIFLTLILLLLFGVRA